MSRLPHTTFSHIGICVSDLQRSTRFYTEAFGFVVSHSLQAGPPFDVMTELSDLEIQATFLKREGVTIELVRYLRPGTRGPAERRPMNQLGLTHLSFTVEDLAAVLDLIGKFGGISHPQTRVKTPAGDLMFCTDPDGTRIELWQKAG